MMATRLTVSAVALALAACASGGSAGGGTNRDLLTREEIQGVGVSTLYEVVERLRPRWLALRGDRSFRTDTGIVVYQGQTLLGGPEALRDLGPEAVESIRYLDGPRASSTLPGLGARHVQHALIVQTRLH
jgi:hypothetical protein